MATCVTVNQLQHCSEYGDAYPSCIQLHRCYQSSRTVRRSATSRRHSGQTHTGSGQDCSSETTRSLTTVKKRRQIFKHRGRVNAQTTQVLAERWPLTSELWPLTETLRKMLHYITVNNTHGCKFIVTNYNIGAKIQMFSGVFTAALFVTLVIAVKVTVASPRFIDAESRAEKFISPTFHLPIWKSRYICVIFAGWNFLVTAYLLTCNLYI